MSHAVRLTIDPQNSMTEVNSGVESSTVGAVDPAVLFTCSTSLQSGCLWVIQESNWCAVEDPDGSDYEQYRVMVYYAV